MAEDDPTLGEVVDSLQELVDAIPEEAIEAYKHRLEFTPERGIYEDARLKAADNAEFVLSSAYYWSTDLQGRHLVDIPHGELPDRQLTALSLQIRTDDGIPLLDGRIVDVGRENGLGGNTTVVVTPKGSDGDL